MPLAGKVCDIRSPSQRREKINHSNTDDSSDFCNISYIPLHMNNSLNLAWNLIFITTLWDKPEQPIIRYRWKLAYLDISVLMVVGYGAMRTLWGVLELLAAIRQLGVYGLSQTYLLCSTDSNCPIQMTRTTLHISQRGLTLLTAFVESLFGVDHFYRF